MSFPLCLETVSLKHQKLQNLSAVSLFPSLKLSFAVIAAELGRRHGSSLPSVFCSLALPLPLFFGCGQEVLLSPSGAALLAHEA